MKLTIDYTPPRFGGDSLYQAIVALGGGFGSVYYAVNGNDQVTDIAILGFGGGGVISLTPGTQPDEIDFINDMFPYTPFLVNKIEA